MNILFISNLTGNLWAGPNNSVPAQILAQSKIDNVFWYNLNHNKRKEWTENGLDCKNLDDIGSGRLNDLPSPFNNPDITVIEGVYLYPFSKMIADIQKAGIPYILIPRSGLTVQSQKRKPFKKIIGNALYFKRMIKKAAAIHYLTQQEKEDSEKINWNKNSFIVPNGMYMPEALSSGSNDGKTITYIGRLEIYQKGLDLLLEACDCLNKELNENHIKINLYGPNQENTKEKLEEIIKSKNLQDIISLGESVIGEEKKKIMLNTDVFLMTSRFEGLPMGLLEALSYGLPCFATRGTNMADEIKETNSGWTAENDLDSIKNQMSKMIYDIKDGTLIKEKSCNARKLAENYNWDSIARKAHDIYLDILKK